MDCAGFIDSHIHYPQTEMVGAMAGAQLNEKHTFPTENALQILNMPAACRRLSSNSCKTAPPRWCLAPITSQSVDALFEEASKIQYASCR